MDRLTNKVSLITGSGSGTMDSILGFGGEAALKFCEEGSTVIISDVDDEKGQRFSDQLNEKGFPAYYRHLNVEKEAEWEETINWICDTFGKLDVLVNNAGVLISMPIEDTTEEQWDAQIDLNLKGTYFMTKAVVPTMKAKGAGKIINVTSTFGFVGGQDCSIYCASKGGQLNLTRALCIELAPHGINVNSLAPGGVKTDMTTALRAQPGLEQCVDALTPAGDHFLNPRDLVGAAVFLASSDSDMVHGAKLVVDGGWTAW